METIIAFLAVLLPLSLSPGPVVIVLAGISMSRGAMAAVPFYLGMQTSVLAVSLAAGYGLVQLLVAWPAAYAAIRYAGIAYIAWLAWKFASARPSPPHEGAGAPGSRAPGYVDGLLATLLNPKFYVMVMAVFSQFLGTGPAAVPKLVAGMWATMTASAAVWWLAGAGLRPLLQSARALHIQSVVFGAMLFAVAAYMLVRGG